MSGPAVLACGRHRLALDRVRIMGVLNVTPDSFSDGGEFTSPAAAIARAAAMRREGADIIDVGGESTRPGAVPVSEQEELARVLPVLEALVREPALADTPISVDTRKAGVMRAAIAAGASMINDVGALRARGAVAAVARSGVAVCLMHMQGTPATMQQAPEYVDVVSEVRAFLAERARACARAGIEDERIVVDPGFAFGKRRVHNIALLRHLEALRSLGFPVLCGLSRKGVIEERRQPRAAGRLASSIAATLAAAARGAAIVRVHDVRETADALRVWSIAMDRGPDA
jgi:dihydropteroate synthase